MSTYTMSTAEQPSERWKLERLCRITASLAYDMVTERCKEKLRHKLLICMGIISNHFSDEAIRIMNIGTNNEPVARKYFEEHYCKPSRIFVKCVGLVVPTWNNYIGASPDGVCCNLDGTETDFIIEIKSPEYMYEYLKRAIAMQSFSKLPLSSDIINRRHYTQMQMQMAIMNKRYCFYIVSSVRDNDFIVILVKFDEKFWNDTYSKLKNIITTMLLPLCEEYNVHPVDLT